MKQKITAVSLFAGVGGFDLALQASNVDVVAAVEIDNAARGVLKHKFPETNLFNDICDVKGSDLIDSGFVPGNGIIVGGFPCQDLSVAGKRAGLDGKRSGLFWEICRLLDETKPKWFILENVPGLLSSNGGRDMGTVIGALVERGYGISWRVLDAQFFGVPQRRRRIFIVGCLGDSGQSPFEILAIPEGRTGDFAPSKQKGKATSTETAAGVGNGSSVSTRDGLTYSPVQDVVGTLSPGAHPGGLNGQDAYTGQLVVGEPEAILMRQREGKDGGGKGPLLSVEKSLTLSTSNDQTLFQPATYPIQGTIIGRSDTAGPQGPGFGNETDPMFTLDTVSGHGVAAVYPIQDGREMDKQQNGLGVGVDGDPAYTLDRVSQQSVAFVKAGRARTVDDVETWREDVVTPTLNVFDNGRDSRATVLSVVDDVQLFENRYDEGLRIHDKTAPTVRSAYGTGGGNVPMVQVGEVVGPLTASGMSRARGTETVESHHYALQHSVVRRLTPVECERLQGFPDGWTELRWDFKKQQLVPQADSARYKQMGNAVAVPVVTWIISRLVALEEGATNV